VEVNGLPLECIRQAWSIEEAQFSVLDHDGRPHIIDRQELTDAVRLFELLPPAAADLAGIWCVAFKIEEIDFGLGLRDGECRAGIV
jgi:hypothetical protein